MHAAEAEALSPILTAIIDEAPVGARDPAPAAHPRLSSPPEQTADAGGVLVYVGIC